MPQLTPDEERELRNWALTWAEAGHIQGRLILKLMDYHNLILASSISSNRANQEFRENRLDEIYNWAADVAVELKVKDYGLAPVAVREAIAQFIRTRGEKCDNQEPEQRRKVD